MTAPPIPVWRAFAPPPVPSPMALWEVDASGVMLGLPGLGSIRVTRDGVTITAPDSMAQDATWSRLGSWATMQFYAAQGFTVLPGCVVAKDGKAALITGAPRHGATLLGLQLTRHGWGLISDGLAVIDGSGTCLSTDPWACVDAQPASRLFPDYPLTPRQSGRDRTNVSPPLHGDAPFTWTVGVRVKESLNSLAVSVYDGDVASERGGEVFSSAVPGSAAGTALPSRPFVAISRPVPTTLSDLETISPVAMAARLAPLLDQLR